MTNAEQNAIIAGLAERYAANKKLRVCLRKVIRDARAPLFGLSEATTLVDSDTEALVQAAKNANLDKFQEAILDLEKAEDERRLLEWELKEAGLGALVERPEDG